MATRTKGQESVTCEQVLGTDNVSDLMTKSLTAAVINRYVDMLNLYFAEDRSAIAQNLHSVKVAELDELQAGKKPTKSESQLAKADGTTSCIKSEGIRYVPPKSSH